MGATKARRTDTASPLELSITGNGPVLGATAIVAIRDAQSSVATPSYLDFDDDTFKTSGWGTRQAALTELGGGFYARALDINAITNLPVATDQLAAEYEVTAPATAIGVAGPDMITLDRFVDDVAGVGFDVATDTLEQIRDRGDAAWITGLTTTQNDRLRKIFKLLGQDPAQPTTHTRALVGTDGAITTPDAEINVTVEQINANTARFTQA